MKVECEEGISSNSFTDREFECVKGGRGKSGRRSDVVRLWSLKRGG